jgi:hypothetical protein
MFKNLILLILLIVMSRFIGLPANFSPLLALAVFMPRLTDDVRIQNLLPVSIVAFTNLFLEQVNIIILAAILLVFAIAPTLSRLRRSLLWGSLSAVFIWHILVNGAVWAVGENSIVETYIAAIPFDLKLAISTGLYILLFYSVERFWMGFSESKIKLLDRFTN